MSATTQHENETQRTEAGTMRAIVQDTYGTTDNWQLIDTAKPEIGPDEVLVRVRAAGLDRGTWHSMTGRPYLMRVMGFGFRGPKNRVPGLATAGTVVAVGSAVSRFSVGDDVYGVSRGAFAEYAAALENKLVRMPSSVTFEQAAAVPVSATTAMQGLRAGRVQAGQTVMVIGASGGVGTYAVQIAKALGAEVTGVCSTAKTELVRAVGADHVIDYTAEDFTDGSRRYDLVLDIGGNTPLRKLRQTLTPTGTLVIVGGENKGNVTGGFGRSLRAPVWSLFLRQHLTMLSSKESYESLEEVTEFIETDKVTPAVDRAYPLDQAHAAMERLEAGQAQGKIVITIEDTAA
jgi:NADPH:quinone reductase-like Zn-dependent oxidoreductase